MTIPHPKNFCGGNFQDWLEVKLTNSCNAKCEWCIEAGGFRPVRSAHWSVLAGSIIDTGTKNVMLLGGEPTLYADLKHLVSCLKESGIKVLITTNGTRLHKPEVLEALKQVDGVNISVHHYDMKRNQEVLKLLINEENLKQAISTLKDAGVPVRLNCNLIAGQIDSLEEVRKFISFARSVGATSVRLAELKIDREKFINARDLFTGENLPIDPFTGGCWHEFVLDGMPINLRMMCGLQTSVRPAPKDPQQFEKQVMYSDGKVREGWVKMNASEKRILKMVAEQKITPEDGEKLIDEIRAEIAAAKKPQKVIPDQGLTGVGCHY